MGLIQQFKNTRSFLEGFSNHLIKLLKLELKRNRTRNYPSGNTVSSPINTSRKRLSDSLEMIQKAGSNSHSFNIKGNQYAFNVNDGRKSGSPPPLGAILDWIKYKPIKLKDTKSKSRSSSNLAIRSLAYSIRESIKLHGIKPTNFIDDAIENSMEKINGIGEPLVEDINLNIHDILLKAGYIKKGENYIIEKDGTN